MGVTHEQSATEEIIRLPPGHSLLVRDDDGAVLLRVDADGTVKVGGNAIGGAAAFVEPTTATPEDIAEALIAAGLMEAS